MFSGTVYAKSKKESNAPVVTYYDEITDINELIQLGVEQYKDQPSMFSSANSDETMLSVEQLLQKAVYPDGTVEENYAQTGIVRTDENGDPILLMDYAYDDLDDPDTQALDGVTVTCTLYFTRRLNSLLIDDYRINKVETRILKSGSVWAVGGYQGYWVDGGGVVLKQMNIYPLQSLSDQTFTLNSTHHNFYLWKGDAGHQGDLGIGGFANINLSNGKYIYLHPHVKK